MHVKNGSPITPLKSGQTPGAGTPDWELRAIVEQAIEARDRFERRRHGCEIWNRAENATGTVVEEYLRSRGITMDIPTSIAFAMLRHPNGNIYPTMVAAVVDVNGKVAGVHRSFLQGNRKADIQPNKLTLGLVKGNAVRLAPAAKTLNICEGIETGLAYQQATGRPTWTSLGTSNLAEIELPIEVATVVIAADGDAAGRAAAHKAAAAYMRQGRRVRIAFAPDGFDFNDVLLGKTS
jgi:DNA primase